MAATAETTATVATTARAAVEDVEAVAEEVPAAAVASRTGSA